MRIRQIAHRLLEDGYASNEREALLAALTLLAYADRLKRIQRAVDRLPRPLRGPHQPAGPG